MTARASTWEHVCSSCRALVLRACGAEDLASRPSCSSCGRIVCDACELGGRCAACWETLQEPLLEELDDERELALVVVDHISVPGRREVFEESSTTDGAR